MSAATTNPFSVSIKVVPDCPIVSSCSFLGSSRDFETRPTFSAPVLHCQQPAPKPILPTKTGRCRFGCGHQEAYFPEVSYVKALLSSVFVRFLYCLQREVCTCDFRKVKVSEKVLKTILLKHLVLS